MMRADNSAQAEQSSEKYQPALKLFQSNLSATPESMIASDPDSLYARLMAVKPDQMTRHAWTIAAGVSRNVFTDVRKRNTLHPHTLDKLLDAIGVSQAQFEGASPVAQPTPTGHRVEAPRTAFTGFDRPRDVPIVGTADCAEIEFAGEDASVAIETMELDLDEVVDFARRPVSLDNRRDVYAIHFSGHSMIPRFEPGELAYVDPKRAPAIRDYVVVQLRRKTGDDDHIFIAMAKRLLRQSASFIELEQFNPPAIFRVDRSQVAHIHRIIPLVELVGF